MIIDAPKREHIPALWTLWQEAFGDTEEFLTTFERTAFSVDRCRCAFENGRLIAALYWFHCTHGEDRIAYLYAIATAKSHRGRGVCRLLMENTHRHLRALGYEGTVLVPGSKELFDFYARLGYRICSYITELHCSASEDGTSLCQIDTEEYARRRRALLPPNGIVQENENLDFLQEQTILYTGEGILLAAQKTNGTLYSPELLGNPAAAPAIVRGLGCTEGVFRIPGDEKPFAMYRSLKGETAVPSFYFGLAFD